MAAELHTHPTALAIFLGSYGGKRDEHVVAVDVSRVKAVEPVAASSEHMGADDAFGEQREPEEKTSKSLLENAAERFDWVDLRGFAPHASAGRMACASTPLPHMRRPDRTRVGWMGAAVHQRSGWQTAAVPQSGTGRYHGDRGP